MSREPRFSVIVPSIGREAGLGGLLDSLDAQSLPREQFEIRVALLPASATPAIRARLAASGAAVVELDASRGPGAARNTAVRGSRGAFLAFTEDDCVVDRDWLANAARRFDEEPDLDVLDGLTEKPGGRPVRRRPGHDPLYLPTNLFVKRAAFDRAGGYGEDYFDPDGNVYFREDSDLGFALEESGARVARDRTVRVLHPDEHAGFLDPLRWTRRHRMDALLARRHPRLFRERIEVTTFGPLRVRRPIVRASGMYVLSLVAAAAAALFGRSGLSVLFLFIAGICLLPIWAKWGFDPRRLPLIPLVPFGLVWALARGWWRVRSIVATDRAAASRGTTAGSRPAS